MLPKYLERGNPAEPEVPDELLLTRLVLAEFRFKVLSNTGCVLEACFSSVRFVFSGDFRLLFWKRSCTVLCFGLNKPPLVLVTLTGEPLTMTKALWLLTDLLGRAVVMSGDLTSAGEVRAGSRKGFGEWAALWMGGFCTDADGCVLPPRTIPLPLNGMTFLIS